MAFNLAIKRSPRYALPYFNAGLIKHKAERLPSEAMKLYKQSLNLDDTLGEARFNIAVV